jgi:hypothetical protein
MLDKKIIEEIQRYRNINNYITEQDAAPGVDLGALAPPPGGVSAPPAPMDATAPPAPELGVDPEPIDVEMDDDVTKVDNKGESEEKKDSDSGTEELDITDLVDSQKNIEKKQEEYFNNLFKQISDLEGKLNDMQSVMDKLNTIDAKIEKYREKTPEEKLQLRSYDSYPFNQKLTDFFEDKKEEIEITGKNDYVLTADDVTDINVNDIKNSFQRETEAQEEILYKPKFGDSFKNNKFR